METLMKDLDISKYPDPYIQQMVGTIEEMTQRHDHNGNGLDFMEMYMASGGKLQDLWFLYFYVPL